MQDQIRKNGGERQPMRARRNDFSQGSIAKNILSLAIPLTVAQLTVVLYNVVDRAFIGHIDAVGRDAFTGIGLVMPVTYIITAFANLCGTGGAPLCAIARGQGDDKRASRIMGVSFTFLLLLGAALTAVFYLFHEPFLYLVGGSDATVRHAKSYLLIYLAGTIPVMISLGMNPFINAQGFGGTGMMTTLLGAVINLILDPIFIFALDMGVRGAALATVIAQSCSALWVLVFLTGRGAILRLTRENLGLDGEILRKVCGLGLTGFTFQVTNSLVQALGNAQLQAYGTAAGMGDLYVAAMTAIVSVREIVMQPVRGLTQGAQPVIGYNYGAGQYSRVRRSILFLTVAGLSYNLAVWLLILAIPHVFILLFNDDPVLLEVGVKTMRVYYAGYVMMAFQMIGQNTFVALGRAKNAVFFSLFRKAILVVPLMLILPRLWNLGAYGIFASEPVSDIVGGLACYITMMLTVWPDMRKPDKVREEN